MTGRRNDTTLMPIALYPVMVSRCSGDISAIFSWALGLIRIAFSVICRKPTFCATTPINAKLAMASTSQGTNQLALRFKSVKVLEGAMKTLISRSPSESVGVASAVEPGRGLAEGVTGVLIGGFLQVEILTDGVTSRKISSSGQFEVETASRRVSCGHLEPFFMASGGLLKSVVAHEFPKPQRSSASPAL